MGFFRGANKTATLETAEVQLNEGYVTALNAFSPMVDGGTIVANVGTRNRLSDSVVWGADLTQSSSGRFTSRNNAKFHRFRFTLTGDAWIDAVGIQIGVEDAPRGARRG